MGQFIENSTDFSAECRRQHGRCTVARENFLFLDAGNEPAAVEHLQRKCGNVVIVPDSSREDQALLYHTSCRRMADVVGQLFADCLGAPASVPGHASELSLGELQRHSITIAYDACRARVEAFDFDDDPGR
ncbi:MAG: hypothetical protein JSU82_13330 [Rhodospirillales bacterium]|nr:MAG: hypothetical protein JSU82_13330 [Rhodospirillales bacterium]